MVLISGGIYVCIDYYQSGEDGNQLEIFDPESLWQHYKQAWTSNPFSRELAPGLSYLTPVTERLVENGTISMSQILSFYNSINSQQKTNFLSSTKKLEACWKKVKTESQSTQSLPFYCYYYWSKYSLLCNQEVKYRNLAKGETELNLIECVGQNQPQTIGDASAIHVEFGISFGAGLYFSGSTGVAFDIPDRSTYIITSTTCRGLKFDISIGGGISVTYLPKMSDLLGDAITVELGMDIPGTEFGVDVLVHFNEAEKRFIGFGLSFGMGIGLSPIDIATSRCNTRQVAEYQSSVKIPIGYAGPYLKCNRTFVGVVSDDRYICCPANNPARSCTEMCWFDGTECPFTPAQEYDKGTTQSKKNAIGYSSCLGQTYVVEATSADSCQSRWNNDNRQEYAVWREQSRQCWFSDTENMTTCSWAPSGFRTVYIR